MARRLVAPADLVPQREGHLGATSIPPSATGATRRGATREPSRASMLAANRLGIRFDKLGGRRIVQSAHPRDVGALALVVGLFLVLFIVSVMLGSPTR